MMTNTMTKKLVSSLKSLFCHTGAPDELTKAHNSHPKPSRSLQNNGASNTSQPIQDTLPAHKRPFLPEWQRSTSMAEEQAQTTMENVVRLYNSKVRPLPEIEIGLKVALENHETKWWDIYGTVTDIGPHRRYFIRMQSGRVLIRNRRFLRCCIPPSIPTLTTNISPTSNLERPCRSTCVRNKPNQLIEEIGISSFRVEDDQEAPVGGDVGNPLNTT